MMQTLYQPMPRLSHTVISRPTAPKAGGNHFCWPCSVCETVMPKLRIKRCQVSLRRFLRTKLASVSAMYEDRYDLWGLRQQPIAGGSEALAVPASTGQKVASRKRGKPLAGFSGLGLLGRKRQAQSADEDWEVVVVGRSMPCRRIAELRRLGGW